MECKGGKRRIRMSSVLLSVAPLPHTDPPSRSLYAALQRRSTIIEATRSGIEKDVLLTSLMLIVIQRRKTGTRTRAHDVLLVHQSRRFCFSLSVVVFFRFESGICICAPMSYRVLSLGARDAHQGHRRLHRTSLQLHQRQS